MQQKLPENIDQLDSFYQEQFKDFSPEVNNAVWESVSNNIPKSASVGTTVSTTYLLKVVGLMLSSIIGISLITNSLNPKKPTNAKEKEVIIPIAPIENEEVEPTVIETERVEEPIIETEVTTTESKEVLEKEITIVKKDSNKVNKTSTSKKDKTDQSDFQFVEELNFDE